MASTNERITTTVLLIGEATSIFAAFCPSWFTVASPFFHDQEAKEGNVKRIRAGETAATMLVLATGYVVSKVLNDWVPLYASIGICAVTVAGYEYQIANPSKQDGQTSDQSGGVWAMSPKDK